MNNRTTAVRNMINLVTDPKHGYDQAHRDGPNYDCSSSVCEAYGIPHYNTTSIPDAFKRLGCDVYKWDGNASDLEPGDLIGTKGKHVVMYIGDGNVAQFSLNEFGGITGGKSGDQTGKESYICPFYNPSGYKWEYVVSPPKDKVPYSKLIVYYSVFTTEDGWLPEVTSDNDYAGIIGQEIKAVKIKTNAGHSIDYSVHYIGRGWSETHNSKSNGYAGDLRTPIDCIKAYAHNDCKSGERVAYRVSPVRGEFYETQFDHETSNGQDGYAGMYGKAIDRLQMW